jgi:hypothetical protein
MKRIRLGLVMMRLLNDNETTTRVAESYEEDAFGDSEDNRWLLANLLIYKEVKRDV